MTHDTLYAEQGNRDQEVTIHQEPEYRQQAESPTQELPQELPQTHGSDNPVVLFGGNGEDELFGEGGDDWLDGGGGDDVLAGGDGADQLLGGEGDDVLQGDGGADRLFGGQGDDIFQGGDGSDYLAGGNGDDVLQGGDGADQLFGDQGDDILHGGNGDTYHGGQGADVFYFDPQGNPEAVARVMDFRPDEGDTLVFLGYESERGVEGLSLVVESTDNGVLLYLTGGEGVVELVGVEAHELSADSVMAA